MTTFYEVWDTETANQIGAFSTQAEAEALLSDVLQVNGPDVAREMAIVACELGTDGQREYRTVVEGAEFVANHMTHA